MGEREEGRQGRRVGARPVGRKSIIRWGVPVLWCGASKYFVRRRPSIFAREIWDFGMGGNVLLAGGACTGSMAAAVYVHEL